MITRTRPAVLAAALLAACGESSPPALVVGPVSFTRSELLGLSDARRHALADLASFGLDVADSATAELGRPVTDAAVEDRVLEIHAANTVLAAAGIGDDVLEARYLTDPAYELTVRHVLFFSERWRTADHRDEARRKAERALADLRAGADFGETAARLSEEPGAEGRHGLLRPGREGAWVDEFWAAASALQVGEISPVTETRYGFHILRLEDRAVVPFAEGRSRVAEEVAWQVGDPAAQLEAWRAPEARAAALAEAAATGVEVPPDEIEAIRRAWTDTATRWAAALGFRAGIGADQVAAAALSALASTAQGAVIAREELAARRDLLEARHPADFSPAGA